MLLVLNISCQNLGDECELECFSAPFGRRVGEYMSVENIGWCWIYYANAECKLESFCAPFGRRVGECTFLNIYVGIEYIMPTLGGSITAFCRDGGGYPPLP